LKGFCLHWDQGLFAFVDEAQMLRAGAQHPRIEGADLGENALSFSITTRARQGIRSAMEGVQGLG
jgi:hypothetical protein